MHIFSNFNHTEYNQPYTYFNLGLSPPMLSLHNSHHIIMSTFNHNISSSIFIFTHQFQYNKIINQTLNIRSLNTCVCARNLTAPPSRLALPIKLITYI